MIQNNFFLAERTSIKRISEKNPVYYFPLYNIPLPHMYKCKHFPIPIRPLGGAVHVLHNLGAYTNGYSVCICPLCALENGDISECCPGLPALISLFVDICVPNSIPMHVTVSHSLLVLKYYVLSASIVLFEDALSIDISVHTFSHKSSRFAKTLNTRYFDSCGIPIDFQIEKCRFL